MLLNYSSWPMGPEGKSMRGLQEKFSSLMKIHIWEEAAFFFSWYYICERIPGITEAILFKEELARDGKVDRINQATLNSQQINQSGSHSSLGFLLYEITDLLTV